MPILTAVGQYSNRAEHDYPIIQIFITIMRLSTSEIFFLELAVWLVLWLLNDYVATLLTLIINDAAAQCIVHLSANAILWYHHQLYLLLRTEQFV